jgi:mono/diheme cytochrome c family protein
MARQPSYRPLEPCSLFPDGMSARALPAGTVARGRVSQELTTFAGPGAGEQPQPGALVGFGAAGAWNAAASLLAAREQALARYVREFPYPVTAEVLERGRDRYMIFCVVCHGPGGRGDGKIVERGYTRPPSFIDDASRGLKHRGVGVLLRDVPAGYYYEVVSKGFGAMPDYAAQVPPEDRWAVIAYVRALQLSGHARLADLPARLREAATSQLEGLHERGGEPSR